MTRNLILFIAALGSGLIAGAFFAFSSFVMGALGKLPPPQGIAAMQSINIVVINPVFMAVLFGTALLSLYLGYAAFQDWGSGTSWYLLAGAILYVIGTAGVTMAFNVPLNDALAAAAPDSADGATLWSTYLSSWTMWNTVRMVAALAASGCYIWALRLLAAP
jgi:uncharacterized membrane protein